MSILIKIYLSFFKIGAFSFGGGYAMLPLIEREIVSTNNWITFKEFVDIIGISQMTPGPIAINSATFVGYKVSGVLGAISATLGVVSFSFILVSIANHYILKFKESYIMKAALSGMRPALIGLIISVFLSMGRESYKDIKSIIIGIIILGILLTNKLHPILVIIISGILGIVFYF
ncbi:chromate transporter [Clostridium sp. CM028]|uniref:chromate transporter n=1 Tax=Clostridium TaxID=1485 RepID=UPI0013EE7433|nr:MULTISPECIES: chromate transporter [Clostridium]MBW9145350.1 chromate transporter [Clostridium sp. CM027]MBW9148835.1 chromate transporter [Clostridium sp. CM028]MBZ9606906.1 chromate transporter [Clostridium estertheticum]UVE42488.1 chromate transporter [Clostridium sp. CM027]WLC63062.1 chromate transporter [Clostridium sp. CM028]